MEAQLLTNNLIKPKILHRAHIKKRLENIFQRPMYFVISGMGFGKTTAVRDFLRKKRKIKTIWFSFERENTEDIWLWVRFCKIIENTNRQLGKRLFEYGMPHSDADRDRLVNAISGEIELETVVVFDDLHLCRSEYIQELIQYLGLAGIPNLHIVMISRDYPMMKVEELVSTKKAGIMTQKNFEFSPTECEDFFILNDAPLSEQEVGELYDKTKGWASGLYLALLHYLMHHDFDSMETGNALVRSAIYDRLTYATKQALLKLSRLTNFTLEQAAFIAEDDAVREVIRTFYDNNCFTKYDADSETYTFHNILSNLLDEEFEKEKLDAAGIYRRQGRWCIICGDRIRAVSAYTKAGTEEDQAIILEIMSEKFASSLMSAAPGVINRAFNQMSLQVKLSNPIGYLTYIYSYSTLMDVKRGAEMLGEAKEFYLTQRNLHDRNQILGEISLIESISAFNDLKKMFDCYEKANDYFDGGTSRIFNSGVIITFGVPLNTFLYHKEIGDMAGLVRLVEDEFWIFNHISNGCGAGFENLVRAEYEYMRANFNEAEMLAYKAIYKAQTKEQTGIILSALFQLMRISIFTGKTREIDEIMLQMMQEVEKNDNPVMLGCYEYILGYVYSYMGKYDLIPQWLIEGKIEEARLMAPARDSAYLIYGKIITEQAKYDKLEEVSSNMERIYTEKGNLTGVMLSKVYKSIAAYHNTGLEPAVKLMKEALALSEPDGCCVSLAENTYEIIPIMEEIESDYARKVIELTKKYLTTKQAYRDGKKHTLLTKREQEVMDLVCNGYTAEAISKILFVSHSTVKKHIAAAYDKLGVNKKADAIAEYKRHLGR